MKALPATLRKIKRDAAREASGIAFTLLLAFPLMTLSDKYGWEREQLDEFADQLGDLYRSFESGLITIDDIHRTLRDEFGIEITLKR